MSKGKWTAGRKTPAIELFLKVCRSRQKRECACCHEVISTDGFYARLSVPNKRQYWAIHVYCSEGFLFKLLENQAKKIERLRGYNPLEVDWIESNRMVPGHIIIEGEN